VEPFPADVSLRVVGDDLRGAQALFPAARNLLFRALGMQGAGLPTVRLYRPIEGGGFVSAFLSGGLKHLYVQPPPRPEGARPTGGLAAEQEDTPMLFVPSMVSGVVRKNGGTFEGPRVVEVSNAPDPSTFELREFNPSATTAGVYGLDPAWQDIEKLGVTSSGTIGEAGDAISAYPKPGMFSGAMKRFYQALLGLGVVRDVAQEEYISGEMPTTEPDVIVFPQFSWLWDRTHGICFQNGVWLIEINKDEGVLAMPVPVFAETTSSSFLGWLESIGDVETADVVREFGGIPTGEPMPTGVTLTDAITAGKVVRIMSAATLEPAYHDADLTLDKWTLAHDIGWAFSETGNKAALTTFYYKDEAKAQTYFPSTIPDPWAPNTYTADQRFMLSEHWHIAIAGLSIDEETGLPVTTATATLTLVERRHVWGAWNRFRDYSYIEDAVLPSLAWRINVWAPVSPHEHSDELIDFDHFGWNHGVVGAAGSGGVYAPDATEVWPDEEGPIMFSYFNGDTEEIVRQHYVLLPHGHIVGGLADLGFYGTSIPTGIAEGEYPMEQLAHLVLPKYCREGYILYGFDFTATEIVYSFGCFDDVGVVEFEQEIGITENEYLYRVCTYNDPTPPSYSGPAVGSPVTAYCGAVINAAAYADYLMTNRCHFDDWPSIANPDFDKSYLQSPGLAYYAIDADTPPTQVTFVGAP
jgi:hypothetical protein